MSGPGPGPAWQCLYSAGPVLLVQPAAAQGRGPAAGPGPGPASPAGAPSCHCLKAAESDGHRHSDAAVLLASLCGTVPRPGGGTAAAVPRGTAPRPAGPGACHGITGHPGDRVGPLTQPVSLSEALTTMTGPALPAQGRGGPAAVADSEGRAGGGPISGRFPTPGRPDWDCLRLESTVATAFST